MSSRHLATQIPSFAIGVLALSSGADQSTRTGERLEVALLAYKYGYFLLDTIEIDPDSEESIPASMAAIWDLAATTDADAFFVRGTAPLAQLDAYATKLRMMIRIVGESRTLRPPGPTH